MTRRLPPRSAAAIIRRAPSRASSSSPTRRASAPSTGSLQTCATSSRRASSAVGAQDQRPRRPPQAPAAAGQDAAASDDGSADRTRRAAPARPSVRSSPAKYPKAIDKLDRDRRQLTAFCAFRAEHGGICEPRMRSSRASPPSSCARAWPRAPARRPPRSGWRSSCSRTCAEERWPRFNGHELVADVLAGATCKDGIWGPRRAPDHATKSSPPGLPSRNDPQLL